MPSLRELQLRFSESILGDTPSDFLQHVMPGRFQAKQHFQVYRNNVFESLTVALKAVHPVTERLVGEGFFRYAANSFISSHPPHSGNLHDFGEDFSDFLKEFPPARELAYLPDVARLEWAWHRSFHAAENLSFPLSDLSAIPTDQYSSLKFALQPSAHLIDSRYPILRIWTVNQEGFLDDQSVNLEEGGNKLLVIRRQQVEIESLTEGDFILLSSLAAGVSLAEATETVLSAHPSYDLLSAMQRFVVTGILAGIRY